jgi:hypothetical protein
MGVMGLEEGGVQLLDSPAQRGRVGILLVAQLSELAQLVHALVELGLHLVRVVENLLHAVGEREPFLEHAPGKRLVRKPQLFALRLVECHREDVTSPTVN